MIFFLYATAAVTGLASFASAQKRYVSSRALRNDIEIDTLMKRAQDLQDIAYATPGKNRVTGQPGHTNTIKYIKDTLDTLNGYYNIELQEFSITVQESGEASLTVAGVNKTDLITLAEFSPSTNGTLTQTLVPVANLGCAASDFPAAVAGKIALISRGTCSFNEKSRYAGAAGAAGAIVYNNLAGPIPGMTLSAEELPIGPAVPTVGIDQASGLDYLAQLGAGAVISADLFVNTTITTVVSQNVIAQTKEGNPDKVVFLGAHSDSVAAGPGINDNGSGSIGILETAVQLAKYKVKNAVRFGWWTAEESGLVGSTVYVANLTAEAKAKIKLYLNFDMIASPNYVYSIYDGDGGDFNLTGPPGSQSIEDLYEHYFASQDEPWISAEFSGRSDYGPFIEAGIASGGLFTGADGNKTAAEVEEFGGTLGVIYDPNYHSAEDTVANLNATAFEVMTKAIAHSAAVYANSLASVDYRNYTSEKRSLGPLEPRFKSTPLFVPNWGRARSLRRRSLMGRSAPVVSRIVRGPCGKKVVV